MRFQTLRYRGVCVLLIVWLGAAAPLAAQDPAALAAEKVKEAEAAVKAAQEAYRKALLAQAAALREQAAALEAKANGTAVPAGAPVAVSPAQPAPAPAAAPAPAPVAAQAAAPAAAKPAPVAPVAALDEKGGEWESRAVFGFHQAGASSSDSAQNYFFDFFIMRGLGSHARVYDSRFNIWGNVRIASSPQQIDSSVSNFVANFATKAGELKVNELAQSGEFLTGLGVKLKAWNQGDRVRMMEAVGFWGANGAFRDPGSSARVYRIPAKDTPGWTVFERNFRQQLAAVGALKQPEFVGFVPPDRERFYRQYGGGLRISTFELNRPYAPPATYMITLGGDQLITEGTYKGAVARADVFYPLPIGKKDGKFQFLFLFGTANLRINKPANLDVLALEPMLNADGKTPSVNLFDPRVLVIPRPSARDTYRIGVGVDFVNLLNSWRGLK